MNMNVSGVCHLIASQKQTTNKKNQRKNKKNSKVQQKKKD